MISNDNVIDVDNVLAIDDDDDEDVELLDDDDGDDARQFATLDERGDAAEAREMLAGEANAMSFEYIIFSRLIAVIIILSMNY